MMTALKRMEFSLRCLPSASFGAALSAATAETPITDQVPADWLLTVTSKSGKGSEGEEGERKKCAECLQ